jgi:hypothetical protein
MIEIDLDGKKVSVPEGSMVMHGFCRNKRVLVRSADEV